MKKTVLPLILFLALFSLSKNCFAAINFPYDLSSKFQEETVLELNSLSQIYGFFTDNRFNFQQGNNLPNFINFQSGRLQIEDNMGGVAILNPLADTPFSSAFYKIEVTIIDEGQQNLKAFLTLIDNWWSQAPNTNGLSVGISTTDSQATYWYHHTDLKESAYGEIGEEEYNFSRQAQSKFVKRRTGEIKIEIYITPLGIYPVIDGANLASHPNLYTGSYLYHHQHCRANGCQPGPLKYIVLGKWNQGGDRIIFKNLKVIELDNTISSVDEVNAHFIKKTLENKHFQQLISGEDVFNGTSGFGNALWAAFLYRGYDYYFHTNHLSQVQQYVDYFLNYLPTYIDQNINRYGNESTLAINHSFINSLQAYPLVSYAISGYLRADQLEKIKNQFARVIDKSMLYIKTDGSFPKTTHYQADTFAEETGWLISLYGGYLALFPNDNPRAEKIKEYLTFLGFHYRSDGKSLNQVYPDISFNYLSSDFKNFVSQYIWPDGKVDNHDFHPSLNYAPIGATAVVKNALSKRGIFIVTLDYNFDLVYQETVKNNLDPQTFHLKHYVPRWVNNQLQVQQDVYHFASDGSIIDFFGLSKPSLMEDWGVCYTYYHPPENSGDYGFADLLAKNSYYLFYTGSGKLFCPHVEVENGQKCSVKDKNWWNYLFGNALYAMAFSPRSHYVAEAPLLPLRNYSRYLPQGDLNLDGKVNALDFGLMVEY